MCEKKESSLPPNDPEKGLRWYRRDRVAESRQHVWVPAEESQSPIQTYSVEGRQTHRQAKLTMPVIEPGKDHIPMLLTYLLSTFIYVKKNK